jgi:VanZ family protein
MACWMDWRGLIVGSRDHQRHTCETEGVDADTQNETGSVWESPLIDAAIWLVAFASTGAILWYSLGPKPPGHGVDKGLHAIAYLINMLAILLAVVWRPGRDDRRLKDLAIPVALCFLAAGGLIEIAQSSLVDRDSQLADWAADAVGVGLALLLLVALRWAIRRRPAVRIDS